MSHYLIKKLSVLLFQNAESKIVEIHIHKNPTELCMLYVAKEHRGGKGVGTILLNYVIDQAKKRKYKELIVRSAEKFIDTGWGFYDHMGFDRVGQLLPSESEKMSQIWAKKL